MYCEARATKCLPMLRPRAAARSMNPFVSSRLSRSVNVSAVERMRRVPAGYRFERVDGFTWKRNILSGGRAAVEASFDRFLAAAHG